ncbi:MAG: lysine--tRNA ligase [candidate division NC10 bacterium]|nr:lysine--tRNA ligase [candidate division NC10 bacterium]
MEEASELIRERHRKLRELIQAGINPYASRYEVKDQAASLLNNHGHASEEGLREERVSAALAGRLVAIREHGRASFAHLQDGSGRIQIYVRQEEVGRESYSLFRKLDIGDFVGVKGHLFRTRTGELTVWAKEIRLLAKSLRPLPEKWHGLSDIETRYRQRYVDLIANPEVGDIFRRRARIIAETRRFFDERGFLEVETPMMQALPGGAAARPFVTYHQALDTTLYLRVAPELYLKRLVVGGLERVYEINRNFRNEGISREHNPEFTMLEFYQAYADYRDLMGLTEELILHVARAVLGTDEVEYQGKKIDLRPPWPRVSMLDAVAEEAGAFPQDLRQAEGLKRLAGEVGVPVDRDGSWGKVLQDLFKALVEPKLIQPTFVCDFPRELSPLAKDKVEDLMLVERFELFIGGLEIANAYSELNDPIEQRKRFQEQMKERQGGDEGVQGIDEDFLRALEYGMPPTAGAGIGIDRLVMVLTNSPSIRDVILFPQLRPEKG